MVIKVPKGFYQIIKGKEVILKTEFLGSGVAIGVLDKINEIGGLCYYVLPYKEHDIEIEDGELVLSGESLIPLFFEELEKSGADFQIAKVVVVGASVYKNNPKDLELPETNLKVAKSLIKKKIAFENNVTFKINFNCQVYAEVNLKEKSIKINLNGKEEIL
ncbi:hypothetical protein [Thermodesulfobacterium hydrogeniphilum]|uniref:hypothetical protein n=1 Tax=Thermodesulfobacterium hydrogeniphilum TaxID=161156 RepID=UPI0005716185|nr:hypothetical protein [Thermodesulfobacterium hydrogeniphilum]